MFIFNTGKRQIVEESLKISAGECVRQYMIGLNNQVTSENDVQEIINNIELGTTYNLKQERNGEIHTTSPNKVLLTYTKSNLNKGYIFWFKCNLCNRRVKYLYFPPGSDVLACRVCRRLAYEKQNELKRFRRLNMILGM